MTVSIICTNYNKGDWIADAIDSFLAQETHFEVEIIIVDDASSDQSPDIIRDYAERYPDKIRAFFNRENQGITKTWVAICKEATGDYIARCDGDDYWIDPKKLEKQVALLEKNSESKWSNTEFDMVTSTGQVTQAKAFENKVLPLITSYEEMLALKGMTMASTWLVERELMLEVNESISLDAIDDTFDLQLELFKRTQLSFLPDSTTVYRMDPESDSRTLNVARLENRFDRLRDTQLAYLKKYPNTDFAKVLEKLLPQHNEFEKRLALSHLPNAYLTGQFITVYIADEKGNFSEEDARHFPVQTKGSLEIELPEQVDLVRIDMTELPSYFKSLRLINVDYQTQILPKHTSGVIIGDQYYFGHHDPQLYFDIASFKSKRFVLDYELYDVTDVTSQDNFVAQLTAQLSDYETLYREHSQLMRQAQHFEQESQAYKQQLEEMVVRYNSVTHSRRWTIPTKLINFFRRK